MMVAVLRMTMRLNRDLADRYFLFRVRHDFQSAFRQITGCMSDACDRCVSREECPYRLIFAQELSADPAAVKRHQKPPLPFAFSFPVFPSPPNAGHDFVIRLSLAGTATRFVGEFVEAVKFLFATQPERYGSLMSLERVDSLGYHDEPTLLWSKGGGVEALDAVTLLETDGLRDTRLMGYSGEMKLQLETPLKLMHGGRAMREFKFTQFMRTLIRRISSLAAYYSDDDLSMDFRWLSSLSESVVVSYNSARWVEWGRGEGDGKLAGLTGDVKLKGIPDEFIPFLLLGEFLNLGKGAAFGLGRFSLSVDES